MTIREHNIQKFEELISKDVSMFGASAYGEALARNKHIDFIIYIVLKTLYSKEKALRIVDAIAYYKNLDLTKHK